jgi:hypothetical protein
MKLKKIVLTSILLLICIVGLQAQNVIIPDAIFKATLVNNASINTNMDTEIQLTEAAAYSGTMYLGGLGIADLTGIETFSAITILYCQNNLLTSLDLTGVQALKHLSCQDNLLLSLNINSSAALIQLQCQNNLLTSLDLTGAQALIYLYCQHNQLTSLNLTGAIALSNLYCQNNQLTNLDLSGASTLGNLYCQNNQLTSIDLTGLTDISTLNCEGNLLTTLTLAGASSLTALDCGYNQLTNIDISTNINLTYLWCNNNLLTNIDVTHNVSLYKLFCYNNQLTYLDLSTVPLSYLFCFNNQLTSLNIKNHSYFGFLNAENNINLTCIEVDDPITSTLYWSYSIPLSTYFTENCGSTGINNLSLHNTPLAYPNPTAGTLFLTEQGDVSLKDLTGNIRLKQKNSKQLDMSSLPAGIYFLQYEGSSTKAYKVVKE